MSQSQTKHRFLLIGPVSKRRYGLIGGATISFGQLVSYLEEQEIPLSLIDTQAFPGGWKKIWNIPYILLGLLFKTPGAAVVWLNTSRGGTRLLAPLAYLISRLFGKRFVFRPFGGDMKDYTAGYSQLDKWIFQRTVLRSDLLFLQTEALMDFYREAKVPIAQLPTARKAAPAALLRNGTSFRQRFVFIGHVKATKGIDEILEVAQQLPDNYTFHIYGPLLEEQYQQVPNWDTRFYQGILPEEEVLATLAEYDVLVLPTYYEGEGYPGVIIEAFSLGLPVITTRWKAIPELVEDGKTGLLIPPNSVAALRQAVRAFNVENYPDFSARARAHFQTHYDAEVVLSKALKTVENLFVNK